MPDPPPRRSALPSLSAKVSAPSPPAALSAPGPGSMKSLAPFPAIVSTPGPPRRLSLCGPPTSVSFPPSPYRLAAASSPLAVLVSVSSPSSPCTLGATCAGKPAAVTLSSPSPKSIVDPVKPKSGPPLFGEPAPTLQSTVWASTGWQALLSPVTVTAPFSWKIQCETPSQPADRSFCSPGAAAHWQTLCDGRSRESSALEPPRRWVERAHDDPPGLSLP